MKLYVLCIGFIVFLCLQFGWFMPYLVSAKSDELFITAVCNVIVSIPLSYIWVKSIVNSIMNLVESKTKDISKNEN